MTHHPRVSVVVVNWNGREHLRACLEALSSQTFRPHEVILVDNGSTDDSLQIASGFPFVRTLPLGRNLGFAGGNNRGIEAASGDYIVLLNNDTRPAKDWLEHLVRAAEPPDVGIVASLLVTWDGTRIDTAGDACTVTGRGLKLQHMEPVEHVGPSRDVFSACAGAALYKRLLIEDVGLLEEEYFMNAEDTDLAFRARLKGWRVYFCADAIVHHRVSATLGRHSASSIYCATRNHIWLYLRCMPGWSFAAYLPHLLIHYFAYAIYFTIRGRGLPFFRGVIAALRCSPRVWTQRREIQSHRRVEVRTICNALTPLGLALAQQASRTR